MFTLIKTQGAARRGRFQTVHGTVETPVFMNVATVAAIKGALSSFDLAQLKCQVELCNTYHLHLRPGDELVAEMGGLRAFMGWQGPVLTDSGGFQVFSLGEVFLPHRRAPHLHGPGGEHAHPVQPGFHHCHGF